MAEEARLESVYTSKAYRGFESPSLRKKGKDPLNNNQRFFFVIVGSMFGDYSSNSVINFLYVERICPILLNDSSNCIARHSSSQ